MLITDFLRKVDKLAVSMKKEQLIEFIHNEARILNENGREEFLSRLDQVSVTSADELKTDNKQIPEDIFKQLSLIEEQLNSIQNGEVSLISEYNEEYDDWYDDEEPYIYHDPEHITDTISSACKLLHTLIDWEKYSEALNFAKTILTLEVNVENEYEDEVSLSFHDLFYYELLSDDFEKIILDMLYAAYMATPISTRSEAVFQLMILSEWKEISLEKLMQHSVRELPQLSEFLGYWTEFLCNQTGTLVENLLREAVNMMTDKEKQIQYAEKYCVTHPCIYEVLFQNQCFADAEEAVQNGRKALTSIPEHYVIRSNIALMTAEYALVSEDTRCAEYCWLEAFRSNPTGTNLLRLMTMSNNFADIENEVRKIIAYDYKTERQYSDYVPGKAKELISCYVSDNTRYTLLFFLGDYGEVLKNGMKIKKTLGWSDTFLKHGIPLFLLLMYNSATLDTATKQMCKITLEYTEFNTLNYCRGTQLKKSESKEVLFWKLFRQIRKSNNLSDEEQENIMDRLADLIEIRTELIVSGQKRNYYNECATYIAAYGEVIEALGETGFKQMLLSKYKSKYPRHSAFIRELKSFGLKC